MVVHFQFYTSGSSVVVHFQFCTSPIFVHPVAVFVHPIAVCIFVFVYLLLYICFCIFAFTAFVHLQLHVLYTFSASMYTWPDRYSACIRQDERAAISYVADE